MDWGALEGHSHERGGLIPEFPVPTWPSRSLPTMASPCRETVTHHRGVPTPSKGCGDQTGARSHPGHPHPPPTPELTMVVEPLPVSVFSKLWGRRGKGWSGWDLVRPREGHRCPQSPCQPMTPPIPRSKEENPRGEAQRIQAKGSPAHHQEGVLHRSRGRRDRLNPAAQTSGIVAQSERLPGGTAGCRRAGPR